MFLLTYAEIKEIIDVIKEDLPEGTYYGWDVQKMCGKAVAMGQARKLVDDLGIRNMVADEVWVWDGNVQTQSYTYNMNYVQKLLKEIE